jgi:hypothetical protein
MRTGDARASWTPPVGVVLVGCGAVARSYYAPALARLVVGGWVALEDITLQSRAHRFPTAKARRLLGFELPVMFEACCRPVAWHAFTGYRVTAAVRIAV